MTQLKSERLSDRPLLATFAVDRIAGDAIPGRYCSAARMWVVADEAGQETPLIDLAPQLSELVTKTKVTQESDDTEISMLEVATKTMANTEQDDEVRWASSLLALVTKTEVAQEQDKQDLDAFGSALLEVTTKTAVELESDDHRTEAGMLEFGFPTTH